MLFFVLRTYVILLRTYVISITYGRNRYNYITYVRNRMVYIDTTCRLKSAACRFIETGRRMKRPRTGWESWDRPIHAWDEVGYTCTCVHICMI